MATKPLAYNPTQTPITGTDLVGSLAVGNTEHRLYEKDRNKVSYQRDLYGFC